MNYRFSYQSAILADLLSVVSQFDYFNNPFPLTLLPSDCETPYLVNLKLIMIYQFIKITGKLFCTTVIQV